MIDTGDALTMDTLPYIIVVAILLFVFGGMGWIIYKGFKRGDWYGAGYVGQNVHYQFQSKSKQEVIEEMRYLEEDEKDEDFGGEEFK